MLIPLYLSLFIICSSHLRHILFIDFGSSDMNSFWHFRQILGVLIFFCFAIESLEVVIWNFVDLLSVDCVDVALFSEYGFHS